MGNKNGEKREKQGIPKEQTAQKWSTMHEKYKFQRKVKLE